MDETWFSCRNTVDPDAPPRERVLRTPSWRVARAIDSSLPGWLVPLPTEHITDLSELGTTASAELGPLLRDMTAALKAETGCMKRYVLLLAEKDGFAHLHFHVVPRAADLTDELKGPQIFALLGADDATRVPLEQQDAIARRLSARLAP